MNITRRDVLRTAAVAGAGTILLPTAAQAATPTWVVPLLERATYGATAHTVAVAAALGTPGAWVEQQLAPTRLADPEGDAVRALYPELGWDIPTTRSRITEFDWESMFALGQGTLSLAAWSRRQLLEVMVEFWSNHLNVTSPSDSVWATRADYDRTVIRRFAMGRFTDLLAASATHPAMLIYLNQADSTKRAPNENYARELLELHTVGVRAGYTESHVKDAARLLTGWTVNDADRAVYDSSVHATGPVRVLGFTHANASPDGRGAVASYLHYLALHPATAQRICRKLAVRFVSDTPSQALIDTLAGIYLRSGSDIRPVLRRLLLGSEMRAGRKLKTPYEDVVSTVRVLGITLLPTSRSAAQRRSGPHALYWMLTSLRQAPMAWGLPDGYPDVATSWQAADVLLGRWNTHQSLAAAWWPDRDRLSIPTSRSLLPGTLPTTYGGLVDALCDRLLLRRLDGTSRNVVLRFCGATSSTPMPSTSEWVGWRLPSLVALILSTPNFLERS